MSRTVQLSLVALLLGAAITFTIGFPLRFLWVAYSHGGL